MTILSDVLSDILNYVLSDILRSILRGIFAQQITQCNNKHISCHAARATIVNMSCSTAMHFLPGRRVGGSTGSDGSAAVCPTAGSVLVAAARARVAVLMRGT